jgi:hypothetical protein
MKLSMRFDLTAACGVAPVPNVIIWVLGVPVAN